MGSVRVPADALPGKATLRVQLSDLSKYKSIPTDIEVELVADDK